MCYVIPLPAFPGHFSWFEEVTLCKNEPVRKENEYVPRERWKLFPWMKDPVSWYGFSLQFVWQLQLCLVLYLFYSMMTVEYLWNPFWRNICVPSKWDGSLVWHSIQTQEAYYKTLHSPFLSGQQIYRHVIYECVYYFFSILVLVRAWHPTLQVLLKATDVRTLLWALHTVAQAQHSPSEPPQTHRQVKLRNCRNLLTACKLLSLVSDSHPASDLLSHPI